MNLFVEKIEELLKKTNKDHFLGRFYYHQFQDSIKAFNHYIKQRPKKMFAVHSNSFYLKDTVESQR